MPGQIGQSVEVESIRRARDTFLDGQYYNENKNHGEWTVRSSVMEKIESIFNEPSEVSIQSAMDKFWSAWQDLSKEPDHIFARAVLSERAMNMTSSFNNASIQLTNYADDITEDIGVKTQEINLLTKQIAAMNKEIYRVEGLGNQANDLRDQRDVLLDDLSKIVNIAVQRVDKGYNITMGSVVLVNEWNEGTPLTTASFIEAYEDGDLKSGEVYGMVHAKEVIIPSYRVQLDTLAKTMAEGDVKVTLPKGSVLPEGTVLDGVTYTGPARKLTADLQVTVKGLNGLHRLGYTMDNTLQPGADFFAKLPGNSTYTAASITVHPDIVANSKNIATSMGTYIDNGGTERVLQGNGDLAIVMSELRNQRINFDSGDPNLPLLPDGTFDGYYRVVISQIGVQGQEAMRQMELHDDILEQIDSRRQSTSGVSLDEELSNMITFQHAYNAAARAMTTFDEMLDKIINGMGVVGR
jgi:flagellar hook-associated protein 1 FlgK